MLKNKLYDVITLYDCVQDPASLAWLITMDVPLPGTIPAGRYPTPDEIRQRLENIPSIDAHFLTGRSCWQATLTHREDVSWAVLELRDYTGNQADPHHFVFTAGWDEVIVLVTVHLARLCGPLVLLPSSGAAPQIIM